VRRDTGKKRNFDSRFILLRKSYLYPSWLKPALPFLKSLGKHPAWHLTHDRHLGPGLASLPQLQEASRSLHRCLSNFKIWFECVELMEFVIECCTQMQLP